MARSAADQKKATTEPVKEQEADAKTEVVPPTTPIEEKASTDAINTDTVVAEDVSTEPVVLKEPSDMIVEYVATDGSTIQKAYNEAIEDIDNEIEECENILNCIKQKG